MENRHRQREETIVIKAGTDALSENGKPSEKIMRRLAHQIAKLRDQARVILITSGAIGTGRSLLPEEVVQELQNHKQALSGLGQRVLMDRWTRIFAAYGMHTAQGLVEDHDFKTEKGKRNIRRSFRQYREIEDRWGEPVLPIINGNDFVSYDPIKNDNDRIASNVAIIEHATHLVILTNVDGLYSGHPDDPASQLISDVHVGRDRWRKHVKREKKSANGTGGFLSKGKAAAAAAREGVQVHIGNSRERNAIRRLLDETIGTTFHR